MEQEVGGMAENTASSSGRNTEVISDIMDFETTSVSEDDCEVMEIDLAVTPLFTTEEISDILDQLTEVINDSKHFLAISAIGTDGSMKMDMEITPIQRTEEVTKIMNQETGGFSVVEINEILDQVIEIITDSKHLSAITEIAAEGSMKMYLETTPIQSAKEVTKIMNQETKGFSMVERVGEISTPNENTTNIVSAKEISKMNNKTATNERKNEESKTLNGRVDMLKVTSRSKRRGLKKKAASTSDMVMDVQ